MHFQSLKQAHVYVSIYTTQDYPGVNAPYDMVQYVKIRNKIITREKDQQSDIAKPFPAGLGVKNTHTYTCKSKMKSVFFNMLIMLSIAFK